MTSLYSTPHIDISLCYDCESSQSLLHIWKATKHSGSSCKRLSNRTWRLVNEQVLMHPNKKIATSHLTLQEQPLRAPSPANMLSNRPSLFSNTSKSTAESVLSLHTSVSAIDDELADNPSDISDISEDGEDGFESDAAEPPLSQNPKAKKFAGTTGSENCSPTSTKPQADSSAVPPSQDPESGKNIFFISNSPSSPNLQDEQHEAPAPNLSRQDSLFGNKLLLKPRSEPNSSDVSSTDISEEEDSDMEEYKQLYEEEASSRNFIDSKSTRSGRSTRSEDNESEWQSMSSDGEQVSEGPKLQPLSFVKRSPHPNPKRTSPIACNSAPRSESSRNSASSLKPRSLLSGLFLNDMNAGSSPTSTKSEVTESWGPKPVLKRSSTTGVISIDPTRKSSGPQSLQKPSLLLSKRYASLTDISKKVPSHRSPVLYITEEDTIKEGDARSEEDNLYAKQTSSVGVSNFSVTAASGSGDDRGQSNRNIRAPSEPEVTLSSSLNKFSSLNQHPSNSLKKMLSSSSINLSSILEQGVNMSNKLWTGVRNKSFEALREHPHQRPESHFSYSSHQSSNETLKNEASAPPKSIKVAQTTAKEFLPSIEVSASLKDSLMIDHKLGKVPLPERVISDEDLFNGFDRKNFIGDSSSNDYHSKGW